jgi:hypothetical protein
MDLQNLCFVYWNMNLIIFVYVRGGKVILSRSMFAGNFSEKKVETFLPHIIKSKPLMVAAIRKLQTQIIGICIKKSIKKPRMNE